MTNMNDIKTVINNDISPLNAKLIRVKNRLDLVKDNLSSILSGYDFIMSHVRELELNNGKDEVFDIFFKIRTPCVDFKVAAEQYNIDKLEFLSKFNEKAPVLLERFHECITKTKELLADSANHDSNIKMVIKKYEANYASLKEDFNSFNDLVGSGFIEKSIDNCEFKIQNLYTEAKKH
ncbi:MAG: hypothetical protein ACYC0J_06300 [Gammaproteobacteria bacterium]